MNKKIRNITSQNKFNIKGNYLDDLWSLNEGEDFKNLTDKQRKNCLKSSPEFLNFNDCLNQYIKEELKYFSYFVLKNKVIMTTFKNYAKAFAYFFEYINIYQNEIQSIIELKKELLINDYEKYLNKINIKTYITKYNIDGNMKKSSFEMYTPYMKCVIYYYDHMYDYYFVENKNEFEKDIWDIRRLPIVINNDKSRPRYKIDFTKIEQKRIRLLAKKFTYQRLTNNSVSRCITDLKGIILFSNFIGEEYPLIQSLSQLNRNVIENFLGFIKTEFNYKRNTVASRIGSIRIFFEFSRLMNWEEKPKEELIYKTDYSKKHRVQPKYYTDEELKGINKHLDKLPIQIARMVFVVETIGIRIGELCKLNVNCLEQDTKGEFVLNYYQTKTQKTNKIPINEEVSSTIEEAIKYSKNKYGDSIKYVFSNDINTPISVQVFNKTLNKLSYENNILDRNGEKLRISGSKFRGTVSTRYANLGLDYNIIMKLLGQTTPGILKYYVEIHDVTVLDSMEKIIEEQNDLIKNIGNTKNIKTYKKEEESLICLSNGYCKKSIKEGKCIHANACYTCRMFKPDFKHINLYRHHLEEARKNIKIAELNNFERILQVNQDLEENLLKIIKKFD